MKNQIQIKKKKNLFKRKNMLIKIMKNCKDKKRKVMKQREIM